MTWEELAAAYRAERLSLGLAASAEKLRWSLGPFLRFLQALEPSPAPGALTMSHLAAFQTAMEASGRAPHTVDGWLTCARTFVRWLVRRGVLLMDPTAAWVLRPPPEPLVRVLTVDQVFRLLEAPPASTPRGLRDRAVLECLYGLAIRLTECQQLDLTDLDLASRSVRLGRTKGGQGRHLPVGEHLAQVLRRYVEEGRPHLVDGPHESALFVSTRTKARLSRHQIQNMVHYYQSVAGLPRVSPHLLRHACATHMLEAGASVRVVQELLGHHEVTTTQGYTHLVPGEIQREHRRTHPRARRKRS